MRDVKKQKKTGVYLGSNISSGFHFAKCAIPRGYYSHYMTNQTKLCLLLKLMGLKIQSARRQYISVYGLDFYTNLKVSVKVDVKP